MSCNLDPNNQAQEVIFTRKFKNVRHAPLIFKITKVSQRTQKYLGLILNSGLPFEEYLTVRKTKVSKTMALLRRLQHILPRHALIAMHNSIKR